MNEGNYSTRRKPPPGSTRHLIRRILNGRSMALEDVQRIARVKWGEGVIVDGTDARFFVCFVPPKRKRRQSA